MNSPSESLKPIIKSPVSESTAIAQSWSWSVTILVIITFALPILVLPGFLEDAFSAPKDALLKIGVSLLLVIYGIKGIKGARVPLWTAGNSLLFFVVLLNFFSFIHTDNYYYTAVAAANNTACLFLFYIVFICVDGRKALWILISGAAAGFLVSLETWLQFYDVFLLFPSAHPGMNVIGTIGNSNYLGAYLLFPLFISVGLFFVVKRRYRPILAVLFFFILMAFVFSRARASWLGFVVATPLFFSFLKRIFNFSLRRYVRFQPKKVVLSSLAFFVLLGIFWSIAPQRLHEMMRWKQVGQSLTLKLRTEKYSRASLQLFKRNPLFGTGLWSFRNTVYDAQAEINRSEVGFFKDYPEPKPREVHNEYLETLNDGGLLAAVVLVLFLGTIMAHGWRVIINEKFERPDRVISATAFCSVTAILISALLFFPFRVTTTLAMTVLMLGTMEGLYLRNHNRLTTAAPPPPRRLRLFITPMLILILAGLVWFTAIRPFMGQLQFFNYRKALAAGKTRHAEDCLLSALKYDPRNTSYCMQAAQLYMGPFQNPGKALDYIDRAIVDFNGDITLYALYHFKGILKLQTGSLFEARDAFEKALYYYPEFKEARQKLEEVKKIIKDHDQVLIKFR